MSDFAFGFRAWLSAPAVSAPTGTDAETEEVDHDLVLAWNQLAEAIDLCGDVRVLRERQTFLNLLTIWRSESGEAEKIAAFLGLLMDELFRDYLVADYWAGDGYNGGDINLLAPGIVGKPTGEWCGDGPVDREEGAHIKARDAWNTPEGQRQVAELLETSSALRRRAPQDGGTR